MDGRQGLRRCFPFDPDPTRTFGILLESGLCCVVVLISKRGLDVEPWMLTHHGESWSNAPIDIEMHWSIFW
jgi:hypothetical protein